MTTPRFQPPRASSSSPDRSQGQQANGLADPARGLFPIATRVQAASSLRILAKSAAGTDPHQIGGATYTLGERARVAGRIMDAASAFGVAVPEVLRKSGGGEADWAALKSQVLGADGNVASLFGGITPASPPATGAAAPLPAPGTGGNEQVRGYFAVPTPGDFSIASDFFPAPGGSFFEKIAPGGPNQVASFYGVPTGASLTLDVRQEPPGGAR